MVVVVVGLPRAVVFVWMVIVVAVEAVVAVGAFGVEALQVGAAGRGLGPYRGDIHIHIHTRDQGRIGCDVHVHARAHGHVDRVVWKTHHSQGRHGHGQDQDQVQSHDRNNCHHHRYDSFAVVEDLMALSLCHCDSFLHKKNIGFRTTNVNNGMAGRLLRHGCS